MPQLAKELGVSQGSLRNWASHRDNAEGLSSAQRDELRPLRRENTILAEEHEFLKKCPWPLLRPRLRGENPDG